MFQRPLFTVDVRSGTGRLIPLRPDQLDGFACLFCGEYAAPMVPVAWFCGGQVFVCRSEVPAVAGPANGAVRAAFGSEINWIGQITNG